MDAAGELTGMYSRVFAGIFWNLKAKANANAKRVRELSDFFYIRSLL
jgi:hypothetical protein